MTRAWLIVIAVAIVLGIASGAVFWIWNSNRSVQYPFVQTSDNRDSIAQLGNPTAYHDEEVGFSFSYPESMTVRDVTPEDEIYYGVVNLTSDTIEGTLTLSIQDTDSATIDKWFSENPVSPKLATLSGATTLGGMPAKQYTYAVGGKQMLLTVALDSGIIYTIDSSGDEQWEEVHILVVSSFTRGASKAAGQSSVTGESDNTSFEEEEIVE